MDEGIVGDARDAVYPLSSSLFHINAQKLADRCVKQRNLGAGVHQGQQINMILVISESHRNVRHQDPGTEGRRRIWLFVVIELHATGMNTASNRGTPNSTTSV